MRACVRVGVVLCLSTLAARAGAVEPPAYLALPAGYGVTRVDYTSYDVVELGRPDPANARALLHEVVAGRRWVVWLKGAPAGATPAALAPALTAAGWSVLRSDATLTARYRVGEREAWLVGTRVEAVTVVEKAAPRRLELTAPADGELSPDADLPFFTPFPGFARQRGQRRDDVGCEVRNDVIKDVAFAGPPSVDLRYFGPADTSPVELQTSYVDALGRAGWDVLATGRGNNTVAHYTKNHRDLWLRFSPGPGALGVCVADVGAAAATAKLARALDAAGHVALYGIYFDLDKATLRPEAEATLLQIERLLAASPKLTLEIQGHTDDAGSHQHNQPLSEARAAAVKAWLVAHHVDAARLTTAGYAETRPVAPNTSPQGRQQNRRVELAKK